METSQIKNRMGNGKPGTYILCLELAKDLPLDIGKLGHFHFRHGFYYYIGSAFGPGGIAARCAHHIQIAGKPRWHIDFLRRHCHLHKIIFSTASRHLEHDWAQQLISNRAFSIPVNGFGSSDCKCQAHLLFSSSRLDPQKTIHDLAEIITF